MLGMFLHQVTMREDVGLAAELRKEIDALAEKTLEEFAAFVKDDTKVPVLEDLRGVFETASNLQRLMRYHRSELRLVMAATTGGDGPLHGFPIDHTCMSEPYPDSYNAVDDWGLLSYRACEVELIVHPMLVGAGDVAHGMLRNLHEPARAWCAPVVLGERWSERHAEWLALTDEARASSRRAMINLRAQESMIKQIRAWEERKKELAAARRRRRGNAGKASA